MLELNLQTHSPAGGEAGPEFQTSNHKVGLFGDQVCLEAILETHFFGSSH